MVECLLCKQNVAGSNPTTSTKQYQALFSIFDNRKLETKENYNSYTREEVSQGKAGGNTYIAKRIRAHDGCLGIGRRRRTRKTATSSGEPSTGFDPEVSEWGNPAGSDPRHRRMNEIVRRSYTQGSETSQYLKEKRSNDIARVVASESAGAQTGELAPRGCGTRTRHRRG